MPLSLAPSVPIVLVPGLSCSPRLFAAQIPHLWQSGHVTVANTLHGSSMAALAASILRDAPARFVLAGLSMGGYIAFEILRQEPERVRGLALLNTSARPDTTEATANRLALMQLAERGKFLLSAAQNYPRSVHPARANDTALQATVIQMARDVGVAAFLRQQKAIISRPDSRPDLPRITCPTLVLGGDSDTLTPPELAQEMATSIPNAHLSIVPQCGHLSTLEQPEAVTAILCEWLQQYSVLGHG